MRSIQEIFNVVIDSGYYSDTDNGRFMCISLNVAFYHAGIITYEERLAAKKAIDDFLTGEWDSYAFLYTALSTHYDLHTFEDRLNVYRNWEESQKLKVW